jgi:opacity protein-like surface antigen
MTDSAARRLLLITMLTALLVCAVPPRDAGAQGFVSPLIGYDFGGDSGCPKITACEDKKMNVGVSLGSLGSAFGSELEFAYAKNFFGEIPASSSSVLTVMGNVLLAPQFAVVRPYASIGIGLIKTRVEFSPSSVLDSASNHFGWNVGGGLMIFPSPHVGVRGEIRYFHAFQDLEVLGIGLGSTKLDFGRAGAGVVFRF